MAWQIGVDVGGTFTDLLALDPERSVFRVAKVPSTPEDQSVGFIAGLAVLETHLAAVAALVHGTTVATNAVLERKGARCGLITTAGFRDVLELGRRTRPNPYGMTRSFEALIPRQCLIVSERTRTHPQPSTWPQRPGRRLPRPNTLLRVACAAATPSTRLAVERMPSFAPNTAARNQPRCSVRCRSRWLTGTRDASWAERKRLCTGGAA
jgi:hypothetical protein